MTLLLDRGASINAQTRYEATALPLWLCSNNTDAVELLLRRGAISGENGVMFLFSAAGNGSLELVRSLTAKGCNINAATELGKTPLREATTKPTSDDFGF